MLTALRMDRRRLRAQALAGHVISLMRQRAPSPQTDFEFDYEKVMRNAILEAFHAEGVEVLTDRDREEMGLPSRGPDGWTIEELIALEERHLANMRAPLPPVIIPAPRGAYERG